MAIPLAPLVGAAVRYGPAAAALLAAVAYARARPGPVDQRAEDLLDEVDEGMETSRTSDGGQLNSKGRLRRTIRLANGRGVELDASFLGRIRVRRV